MEEWKTYKLRELIEGTKSGDWGKESPSGKFISKVNCIRGADIPELAIGNKGKMPIRYISEHNCRERKLSVGELVVELSGGSPTQSTGRITIIREELLSEQNCDFICSNFCKVLKVKESIVRPSFFYYIWQHLYDKGVFFQYENGTTGIKNLDIESIFDYEIVSIPHIEIQDKIVEVLDSFLYKTIINRKINDNFKISA